MSADFLVIKEENFQKNLPNSYQSDITLVGNVISSEPITKFEKIFRKFGEKLHCLFCAECAILALCHRRRKTQMSLFHKIVHCGVY